MRYAEKRAVKENIALRIAKKRDIFYPGRYFCHLLGIC
jgi:hypothetical protein